MLCSDKLDPSVSGRLHQHKVFKRNENKHLALGIYYSIFPSHVVSKRDRDTNRTITSVNRQ